MSVFASPIRNKSWVGPITVLGFALGCLLALSLKTQDRIRKEQLPTTRITGLASAYAELRETVAEQKKKIADLQGNLTRYQKAAAGGEETTKLLSADLQKANVLAGLTAVEGPGVVVTLKDSVKLPPRGDIPPAEYTEMIKPYIIHDSDIQAVLNELRSAGAEAIAVNDQRVVATTAVRCVGPTVHVNGTPTGVPVKIQAIGDPDLLVSSLSMAGGVGKSYELTDPKMFSVDKVKNLTLPAYAGATPLKYAKPAAEHRAAQAQKQSEEATNPGP